MEVPATWYFFCAHIPFTQHLAQLCQQYGSFEAVWLAVDERSWCSSPNHHKSWQRLQSVKNNITYYQELYLACGHQRMWLIDWNDRDYPPLLRHIYAPPLILSGQGDRALLGKTCVSIVGTRQATTYGKQITSEIVQVLAPYDVLFVSGLAYGIDSVVHDTAERYQLPSVGIIAASLWHQHWGGNAQLRSTLDPNQHLFLSETTKDERIQRYHFAKRNRLIAGLSQWTIVVEAPVTSGALITARCARDENRDVLVIPHSLTQTMGSGCLLLIHDGAEIITQVADIPILMGLNELPGSPNLPQWQYANDNEKTVHELFLQGYSLDVISQKTAQSGFELFTVLSDLVLRGYLKQDSDGSYRAK